MGEPRGWVVVVRVATVGCSEGVKVGESVVEIVSGLTPMVGSTVFDKIVLGPDDCIAGKKTG